MCVYGGFDRGFDRGFGKTVNHFSSDCQIDIADPPFGFVQCSLVA